MALLEPARLLFFGKNCYLHVYLGSTIIKQVRVLHVFVSFVVFEKIEEIQEKTWIENHAVGYICPALYFRNAPFLFI